MRSIPIDNRIYGGKLARVGDGIRGCSSAREPGEMEASAPRRTLKLSSSLRLRLSRPRLLHPCPLVLSACFSFLFFFPISVSLHLSFPLPPSFSTSLIPIFSFPPPPPPPPLSLLALFRRLNQPAEETTRRGGAGGSRRGRRGRPEKDRREGEGERAVDEHKHGILSDVDVYVNAEYLMGCQKQSL